VICPVQLVEPVLLVKDTERSRAEVFVRVNGRVCELPTLLGGNRLGTEKDTLAFLTLSTASYAFQGTVRVQGSACEVSRLLGPEPPGTDEAGHMALLTANQDVQRAQTAEMGMLSEKSAESLFG